jgi:hypothetical protein
MIMVAFAYRSSPYLLYDFRGRIVGIHMKQLTMFSVGLTIPRVFPWKNSWHTHETVNYSMFSVGLTIPRV